MIWSLVLQIMGFSEIFKVSTGKAFGIWILGQLIGGLAALFLAVIVMTLVPGTGP
jgi:hypothetical protein